MEQHVVVKYWRRPLLKPLFMLFLWLVYIVVTIIHAYSDHMKIGHPFQLYENSAIIIISFAMIVICYFLFFASRIISDISIMNGEIRLARRLGRTLSLNIDKAMLRGDYLYIGKFDMFDLDGLIDKEKIKDLLAARLTVVREEPQVFRFLGYMAKSINVLITSLPLILLFSGKELWEWIVALILAAVAAAAFAWVVRCLAMK